MEGPLRRGGAHVGLSEQRQEAGGERGWQREGQGQGGEGQEGKSTHSSVRVCSGEIVFYVDAGNPTATPRETARKRQAFLVLSSAFPLEGSLDCS